MAIKVNKSRKAFIVFNYIFCILIGIVCIMPVIHTFSISLSGRNAVYSGRVSFWPLEFTKENYNTIFADRQFFVSYGVTILRAILGWIIGLIVTVLAAYPMSLRRVNFPARQGFVVYFMVIMMFNGGMIPTYLVVKEVGLLDKIWALILPGTVSTYNIILMMNFMKGLPESISESAFIDGAGHFRTLFMIILPLCLPSLATISLFIVLGHWNAWFDGMIYINNPNLKPLQTYLRSVILVDTAVQNLSVDDMMAEVTSEGADAAKIFCAILPVMCVYPFLQKHFAKGIVRGSVKE